MIITTYNDADYLRRSIPSAINQTLKPKEIIIIDDGSDNDSSRLLTNSFAENTDIPMIYQKKENGGPCQKNVVSRCTRGAKHWEMVEDRWMESKLLRGDDW